MILARYEVGQELARNAWFVLCRGQSREDGTAVLLKTAYGPATSPVEAQLLAYEYALLQDVALPGVVRVRELLHEDGGSCLVYEDPGGLPLQALLPWRRADPDTFLPLAIQLTTILATLHRHAIVHQHLTPWSILLHPMTRAVCLADFSLASRTGHETHTLLPIDLQHCTLAYLSPEQTGRMNRAVDYRTDLYSLGILFYELLTGSPPFCSDDALELMHWHIAKTPPAPADLCPEIPVVLSDLVLKLLAKTAEERYQSAAGVQRDLEQCAAAWAARRQMVPFALGQHDMTDRFLMPQKLYGREREMQALQQAFQHSCQGDTTLLLVDGYAGIGKTSLIQELYKTIVRQQGYFIAGKCDQVVRSVPFGALLQAFGDFIRQLLSASEEHMALWRRRLVEALGSNGGVMTEVIPALALIIGAQPSPPVLGPTEALNRFQLVLQHFVGALARPEHPLVIFLDDLQWADPATLSLLQPLLTSQDIRCLLLIAAYRDNEVYAGHPLLRTLTILESHRGVLQHVTPGPLQLADVTRLIQDVMHGTRAEVEPLAQVVLEKTAGNPFFVIQFLRTLHQEGYLLFDQQQQRWTYHLERIAGAAITDNVIDLMTRKIQRLSAATQHLVMLAACIGNPFDRNTLAMVSESTLTATAAGLHEALAEGLILPAARHYDVTARQAADTAAVPTYVFLHDRVQQAAYALIPAAQQQSVHLTVGRLLQARAQQEQTEAQLFDIAHHLNLGSHLMTDETERLALAGLNLRAGQKAKSATAYEAARNHLETGLGLLPEAPWEWPYDLVFALHLEAAECQYLCGHFDRAEQQFTALISRARTALEKARVYNLRGVQYEHQARYTEALANARACLALFDVGFPSADDDKQAALEREIAAIQEVLEQRSIASLLDLPTMSQPETRMVMTILTDIWASAYILGDALLARLISATMVRLSLQRGNVEESAYGYVTHAITVGPVRGDYRAAYEFGRLALAVNERFHDTRRRAKIYQQFHAHVNLWRQPMHTCITYAREACRSGLEAGDFLYAVYGAATETWPAFVATPDLGQFVQDYAPSLGLIRKLQNKGFGDAHQLMLNWARALQGETRAPRSLSHDDFDESRYVADYRGQPFFSMFYNTARLHLGYVFEDYEQALQAMQRARQMAPHLAGTIWPVLLDFWGGLLLAACYSDATPETQRAYLQDIAQSQTALAVLADNCPENFRCQALLLAAELERLRERPLAAMDLYEQALHEAQETQSVQHQALAHELYARFCLQRGQNKIAAALLYEARSGYAQWGATAKVAALEYKYRDLLLRPVPAHVPRPAAPVAVLAPAEAAVSNLDVATLMKAAQAITGELDLEKLLGTLIRIAIENAGAERGCLLLEHEGTAWLYAEGSLEATTVRMHSAIPLVAVESLPTSIVYYVRRTQENVVLTDARSDARYGLDPYIQRCQPRSILCVPVRTQGRLLGVLYLEHHRLTDAFPSARIQMLQMLASPAAISLDNALLYDSVKQEVVERRQTEEMLRAVTAGTAAVTGDDFFASLVGHLAVALQVRYAFVARCLDDRQSQVQTLAFWMGDHLGENVTYNVAETPCQDVLNGRTCLYGDNVQARFPHDRKLVTLGATSYVGLPILNAAAQVIGYLAVLDDKPMSEEARRLAVLKIFAARAGAELERLHAEEELRSALAEVETLKNRLQAENVYLQEEIRQEHNFEEMVGNSPALLHMLRQIELVAATDATVLVSGETGTGKELIARALHSHSARKQRPLVKVNCGAIAAGLVESELFGHVKGAFTGALERRVGRFELANGGTIFLDEVGELPLDTQVKLLRILQEQEFEPVGSSRTVRVDVRIIAATNRHLDEAVRSGRFRADLFYRLNVFPIAVPPLRERRGDIPQLVMFFVSRFAKKLGKRIEAVAQTTMDLLTTYAWPGNVRELQNLSERMVVLAPGPVLMLDSPLGSLSVRSPADTGTDKGHGPALTPDRASASPPPRSLAPAAAPTLEDVEKHHILTVLQQTAWVIEGPRGAAKILNLHPNTLRSRMKKMGIQRTAHDIS